MIGSLEGELSYCQGENIIVNVAGVGYQLLVSEALAAGLGEINSQVSLVVYTDVKENAITLYGFEDHLEREVFLLLKKVKGIGSRLALNIISSVGAKGLLSIIGQGEVKELQSISGIGKKTAERLLVELGEHVGELAQGSAPVVSQKRRVGEVSQLEPGAPSDAILALEKLGFPSAMAREAVETTIAAVETSDPNLVHDSGELVKRALANM